MTLTSNRRGIAALMRWGLATRVFCLCTLDGWSLLNAGWICALVGSLLVAPLALLMWSMQRDDAAAAPSVLMDNALGQGARRALCLLLCAASLYELAISARFATLSAAFSAFDQSPDWALIAITVVSALLCTLTGGNGVTGAAEVFRWLVYFFLGATWVIQSPSINYRWIMPIFGPGWPELLRGSLSVAGIETAILAAWLCMNAESGQSQEGGRPYRTTGPTFMLKGLISFTAIVMLMTALVSMIVPATPGAPTERDYALERFLTNGRVPNMVQFPHMLIWFITQTIMVAFNMFISSAMLYQAAPKIPAWVCALLCAGAGIALSVSPLASRDTIDLINTWRYGLVTAAFLPFAVAHWIKQRGQAHAHA